ncbi:P-loop containing nucleoside triphosphate hydrolase protein [Obelidium mucronatum]|nr:P-loop containing nucleoside triphosphate hydrolase protein [Obelidium mucronatum]
MTSPGTFRPPSAFIKASLARQTKVKNLRSNPTDLLEDAIPSSSSSSSPHHHRNHKLSSPISSELEDTLKNPLSRFSSPTQSNSVKKNSYPSSSLSKSKSKSDAAAAAAATAATTATSRTTPSKTAIEIAKLKAARDSRRAAAAEIKSIQDALCPSEKETRTYRSDIAMFRKKYKDFMSNVVADAPDGDVHHLDSRIRVCVRKRSMSKKEIAKDAYDIVTTTTIAYPHSQIYIHEPKTRVDMSKYTETHPFIMDYSFDESSSNEQVYMATGKPLVKSIFEGGMCTFFAYGQTGSGKTHTIFGNSTEPGIYSYICRDIFLEMQSNTSSSSLNEATPPCKPHLLCSFFEIYGPKINDLLSPSSTTTPPVTLCEDKHGSVNLMNLHEETITSLPDLLSLVQRGRSLRTTRATNANNESSRSHALFQIRVVNGDGYLTGVLSLVDLAGSERGMDSVGLTKHDKKIQSEAAEINKSLLSLKECIRALYKRNCVSGGTAATAAQPESHVPFRGSKLTHILRDSFLCKESQTVMVATISPGSNSVEHTLNTLRYADRVKELGRDGGCKDIHFKPAVSQLGPLESIARLAPRRESSPWRDDGIGDLDELDQSSHQQTIAELQLDRNLVSSLGNYGASDSEEESQRSKVSFPPRSNPLSCSNDMNALQHAIRQPNILLTDKTFAPPLPKKELREELETDKSSHTEVPAVSGDKGKGRHQTESDSDLDSDYFYQDALSVESPEGGSTGSSEDDVDDTNDVEEEEEDRVKHGDADEAEWRRYCRSRQGAEPDSEHTLRTRHAVLVQEQLMEIDRLLLERVRSGRMGVGAYVEQLAALLAQRVDALARSTS